MINRLICLSLMLISHHALAADLIATWEHPKLRQDDSELTLEEIQASRIEWSCRNKPAESIDIPAPSAEANFTIRNHGKCSFVIYTIDTYNQLGEASEPVELLVLPAHPKRPNLFRVRF